MSGEDAVYSLTVDLPTSPKGEPVQIAGLGTFDNGKTYTVSKEQADFFRSFNAVLVDDVDDKGNVVGSKLEQGPTLLEAAKTMYGVEVSTADSKQQHKETSKSVTTTDTDKTPPQQHAPGTPDTTREGGTGK